jgi:hypothetical protein
METTRVKEATAPSVSVLLFNPGQARDIVRIERDLGHGFKFVLAGPPSVEATLKAAAKTSSIACDSVPEETAQYFKESAALLLEAGDPVDVVARCLAAISRRSTEVQSRSLITGEAGYATVEMSTAGGRPVAPNDVLYTVSKLSRMSNRDGDGDLSFDGDIGKIKSNSESGSAVFDMSVEDAKRLVAFSQDNDEKGAAFTIWKNLEIERGRDFGRSMGGRGGGGGGRYGRDGGGRFSRSGGGRGGGGGGGGRGGSYSRSSGDRSGGGRGGGSGYGGGGDRSSGGGSGGYERRGGGDRSGGGGSGGYERRGGGGGGDRRGGDFSGRYDSGRSSGGGGDGS